MKSARRHDCLARIRAAATQIHLYTEGFDREGFLSDQKTQDAVVMKLLVIGELAARLLDDDPAFTSATTTVPWRQMKGMRNRMAHGYFELDMRVVWETVQNAIPALIRALDEIHTR